MIVRLLSHLQVHNHDSRPHFCLTLSPILSDLEEAYRNKRYHTDGNYDRDDDCGWWCWNSSVGLMKVRRF